MKFEIPQNSLPSIHTLNDAKRAPKSLSFRFFHKPSYFTHFLFLLSLRHKIKLSLEKLLTPQSRLLLAWCVGNFSFSLFGLSQRLFTYILYILCTIICWGKKKILISGSAAERAREKNEGKFIKFRCVGGRREEKKSTMESRNIFKVEVEIFLQIELTRTENST